MLDNHIIENIERFVEAELSCRKHPGSSLSVIKEGELAWSKGFGYADVDEKKRSKAETVYRCASVTKPVVTVGLLQLMEKGKFDLNDEVKSHLDVKIRDVRGDDPTIRDLLTHRSGMPTRVPPIYLLDEKPLTMKGYIESAARAVRPRGETWAYCNTSYMIAGYLIEVFSGKTYDNYLMEKVLKPLEMNSSAFTLTPDIQRKLTQGYKRAGGPEKPLIPVTPYLLGTMPEDPAGSLYSTVLDLGNFVIMNMNGGSFKGRRLLKEETINEMHLLQAPSGNSRSGMGLTWFYSIHDGHVMLNHTGGLPDFTNNVCFYPEQKVGVCWLSNLQDGSGWRPPSPSILRIVLEEKLSVSDGFQNVPDNWDKICGVYGDETRQVTLGIQNGYIVLDNRAFLERITDTNYIAHGMSNNGYEVTIEYGADGKAKCINFGTSTLYRYNPVLPEFDKDLELNGKWSGEFYDSFGFHTIEIVVNDEANGIIMEHQGETIPLDEFRAKDGKVIGSFKRSFPEEYARWGTRDYIEVYLDLSAISGKLKGFLKSGESSIPITMIKST